MSVVVNIDLSANVALWHTATALHPIAAILLHKCCLTSGTSSHNRFVYEPFPDSLS